MRCRRALWAVGVFAITACAGSDDADPAATTVAPTTTVVPTTTLALTTTTLTPTTTIDEAAVLAEIEQAYLDAFWVATEALRNPDDPDNEVRIRNHFTGPNLDAALEDLRRMIEGGLVAQENPENPSLAVVIGEFEVDALSELAVVTVCEFNSDRIYEVGTAPDGTDSLRRDDPASFLVVVEMRFEDGVWRSATGNVNETLRSEEERCSNVA